MPHANVLDVGEALSDLGDAALQATRKLLVSFEAIPGPAGTVVPALLDSALVTVIRDAPSESERVAAGIAGW